ncbi:MAG: NAD(P)H-hydrate dehydratase [Planctomycetia bacterium]|nr:NAD(P)H-hydrate dehydratase [Planctomycetia bacterium]
MPAPRTNDVPGDLPRLRPRDRDTSKRDYGRVLVVGGSAGMAGAPSLAALAALKSGAGLVELVVPESVAAIAAGFDPCVMTRGVAAADDGTFSAAAAEAIMERARLADAVAVGPGIGRSAGAAAIVERLWAELPQAAVLDADALWALAQAEPAKLTSHAGPRILTPHAGEMLRLLHRDAPLPRPDLEEATAALAADLRAIFVLKGPATLVTDGTRRTHNTSGNPGMATAGCGDVLTGVVAALLCQPLVGDAGLPFDVARLAAWVHGRAGDIAAERVGEVSLTATDVLAGLPAAFSAVVAPRVPPAA